MNKIFKTILLLLPSFIRIKVFSILSKNTLSKIFADDLTILATIYGTDKWGSHWYTPHYQEHFCKLKLKKLNILEIGVGGYEAPDKGGESLKMWKQYFPKSNIYSVDIYDKSALQEDRIKIFKGSQIDKEFMLEVYKKMGGVDIIIDDGSHINQHVIESFKFMFPLLKNGGIYVVEDLQTSYWSQFGGDGRDLNNPNTSMSFFKQLVDCLNYEELPDDKYKPSYYDENIIAMHFYHNIIFIYKGVNKEGSNIIKRNAS